MKMNVLDKIGILLLAVGGLNWGLVGLFDFNLVDSIFGVGSILARIVYAIVGLAALYGIYFLVKMMGGSASKM
jgi:uncharacterized membrane protein YuzA (DUF378 family)